MAIFSRRILQRLINENAQIMRRKQIRRHVSDLNRMHETLTLAAEWEVVLFNAFIKLGHVLYEHDFGGSRYPDLYFQSHENPAQTFVADISAISDKGFESRHSFDALDEELRSRVQKRGFNPSHFHLDVQGNHPEIQRGHYYREKGDDRNTLLYKGAVKAELHMPGPAKFSEKIFNHEWERFLNELRSSPAHYVYRVYKPEERINIAISFNPGQRFGSSTHLAYKQINHLTENRVFETLKGKAVQLIDSKFSGPLGIILCDGGYSPFHATNHFSTHSMIQVISYFLRNNPAVSFVLTLIIKSGSYHGSVNEIVPRLYVNGESALHYQAIEQLIGKLINVLPQPESNAFNALNLLRGGTPQEGRQNGELILSSSEIKISARILMELLSGRLTHEEFVNRFDKIPFGCRPPDYTNFFDMRLKSGMLINDINIEKSDTQDDDVITINLRGPDPAIHPFVAPE